MQFVPLSEIKDQDQDFQFVPLKFEPIEPAAPILSPEEQVMGAIGAPGEPAPPPRAKPTGPELRPYEPTLWERFLSLVPGDRAKAANEYTARQIAKEQNISVDEAYRRMKEAVGVRGIMGGRPSGQPMFNPEGRAPIKAVTEAAPYVFEGLLDIPKGMAEAALRTYRAGDIENAVDTGTVDKMITYLGDESKDIFIPNVPERLGLDKKDPNYQGFMGLGKSLGYSLTTMVASAAAGAAATPAGPYGQVAAGMGTSGAVAYRASKDDFLNRLRDKLNDDSKRVFNRPLTNAEWNEAKKKFNAAAVEYGAWEAVPEAISNAIFLKAFAAPAKTAKGAKLAGYLEKATSVATENITETATGLGQNAAELKAGLTQDELTLADAFKQQFIQTMLTMGVTAGGIKGAQAANRFYNEQVLPKVDPASALAKAIKADLESVGYTPAAFRMKSAETVETAPPTFTPVAPPPPTAEEPPEPIAERAEPTLTFEPLEQPVAEARVEPQLEAPAPAAEPRQRMVRPEDLGEERVPGMPTGEELEMAPEATVTPVTVAQPSLAEQAVAAPAAEPTTPETVVASPAAAALPETPAVAPVTQPKLPDIPPVNYEAQGLPIQEVPLTELKLSKDVPQFKIGASEKGVVEPLGGKFERTGVAPIQVWERNDGTLEVISGRHRFDLAQRSGEQTIPAQIHREADGFGQLQAAILDAELNIRDGQGKVKDYVNYFKESGIDREDAESRGLLARATGKRSFTIANQGSDELIASVRADQIGDEAAYYIALNAPGDSRLQSVGIKAIQDGKSANTATNMMQAVKALAGEQDTTTDMFGFDDSAIKEAEEMAKIASQKQREIQTRLSAISGAAKNPAVAKAEGIDIKDPEAVKRRIDELRQMKASWDNWSTNPQLVAEIRQARGVPAPELAPIEQPVEAPAAETGPGLFEQPAEQLADTTDTPAEEAAQIADEDIRAKLMRVADNLGVRVFETSDRPMAGDGYVAIPTEDKLAENMQSAEQVFAHELGHAIMQKRGMSFNGMPHEQISGKWIKGWPQIRAISKAFRPEVYKSSMPKMRRHANKPDEIIADALGSFLLGQSTFEQIKPLTEGLGLTEYDLGLKPSRRREMEDKALAEIELKAQTAEELRQKAEREAAEAKRAKQEEQEAERKAKADQEVGEFVLTGSDRAADEAAARGQQDIFGLAEEPVEADKMEPVRKMAERLLAKGTERYDESELDNKLYQVRTRTFEGKLFGSELRLVQDAIGSATDVTLINTDNQVMTLQFTGKYVGEGRNVRIMDSQYTAMSDLAAAEGNPPDENSSGFIGASDKEVADVAKAFKEAEKTQDAEGVTRIFEPPRRQEVMRMEAFVKMTTEKTGYLTVPQAKQRIEEWKKNARQQGETNANSDKIVLSLFDMTGEWSRPWEEAGYQVYRFDIQTDPEMGDVNKFSAEFFNDLYGAFEGQDVYAILAACPCTDFASSGARHFAAKDADGRTVESVELVHQTLRTVEYFKPSIWAIENPVGRIEKLTGLPPWRLSFNPSNFGDPYTKKTLLWGRFNADLPAAPVEATEGSKMMKYGGKSLKTKNARSVTPEGFAYAFFEANNAVDHPAMALANKYDMMSGGLFQKALDAGLSEKQITEIVDDPYYFSQDYDLADAELQAAIEQARGGPAVENIDIREEQIKEYAKLRAKLARVPKAVAEGKADLDMQETVARLMQRARDLNVAIKATKPRRDSAEKFLAKALTEYDNDNISEEVLNVIKVAYDKYPELLDGLLLSVKAKPEGRGAAVGEFVPWVRLVRLYKGTSGVVDPVTIRHELTHTLEQMMTPEQRMAVVQAWGKALARAIKQNPDELHQKYFNAVLDFLDKPSERTLRLAQNAMPSYDMYQYINPSEFWAVNGEKLMAAQLGGAWDKFKRAIRRLWEGIKKVLGFDNRYDVHKVFGQVMTGSKERIREDMLVDMVRRSGGDYVTLENIEDDKKLMEKYNRPHTPQLDTTPIKTFITRQFKNGKEFFQDAAENPREAMVGAGDSVMDGLIYLRNKNVWYGSGLEARDFDRYNGELRTSEGFATGSVALDNAIRSGNIGVEVIFRGGIKFDPKSNTFVAVERELGMKGVYEAEKALKDKLGDQLGTDIIQGYLEAKRSISIMNELYEREAAFEAAKENLKNLREMGVDEEQIAEAKAVAEELSADLDAIKKAASSVNMSEEEMYEFAALDEKHPELRDIMDNWTAINQNLLRFWRQVGLLSQGRYDTLSAIKDYVPWYRIMADEEDVHSPLQATTRSLTNIGREKLFKRGKPLSVVDFRAKGGQKDFKIQPSSVVKVKVNGKPVADDLVSVTPNGEVRLDMDLKDNDLVVFETNREIENIIDNMTRNVMRMTMNGIRQYAANRIVLEYGSRNEKGKIMTFPSVDKEKGRFNWTVNGKKVVVEIQDPLVASSIYGMENLNLQMWAPLAAVANLTRRTITLSGVFQLKQVFKDAPTAALVTGVKNPLALIGGVWKGFLTSLVNADPAADILKAAGIGGFHSPARTPEAEIKRRLGIMNRNVFSAVIKGLDHIGDASDMAQRVATYKRVLKETGDETQALYQAANVINFMHHGSAGYAQAAVKVVPFLGAYANAMDVLVRALMGGGLKGMSRKKALARLTITMSMLVSLTLLYAMLAGADPEYDELDDQTKLKNIIIPGTKIMLPMNTSAAYFFKAIPELIYNKVTREGTENEYDRRRLRKALGDAARDMLLGPEPIPAGVKPIFEVAINHDFFTGRPVIPEGLKDVEAAEQYTASTSELGKKLSAMLEIPGTDGKRVISPVEADHLIRGIFGTSGAMAQWVSNSIGAMAEARPEPTARETPITGSFLRDEVPRGREDLFYDFKEAVNEKYQTWKKMMDRGDDAAADAYIEKHGDVAAMYEYINETEADLKEINSEIRRLGETREKDMTPRERRLEIEDYKRLKADILDPVKDLRREVLK